MKRFWKALCALNTSVWVVLSLTAVLWLLYWGWSYWWNPDPEKVFQQTLANNLATQSLTLQTSIRATLPQSSIELTKTDLDLEFSPKMRTRWSQKNLTYAKELESFNISPQQVKQYIEQAGQVPSREYYIQDCYSIDDILYFRHDVTTSPQIDGWSSRFKDSLEVLPWGKTWYEYDLSRQDTSASWPHFVLQVTSSNGFLYGHLPVKERRELLEILIPAYRLQLEDTASLTRNGRLYYVYKFKLDYARFSQALVKHYNTLSEPSRRIDLSEREARRILRKQETLYSATIDVRSREVVSVSYPLAIPFAQPFASLSEEDIVIWSQFSQLVRYLNDHARLQINVQTQIFNQNQRKNWSNPPKANKRVLP